MTSISSRCALFIHSVQ